MSETKIISTDELNKIHAEACVLNKGFKLSLLREVTLNGAVLDGKEDQTGTIYSQLEMSIRPEFNAFINEKGLTRIAANIGLRRQILKTGDILVAEVLESDGIATKTRYLWNAVAGFDGTFFYSEQPMEDQSAQMVNCAFSTHAIDFWLETRLSNGNHMSTHGEFRQIVDLIDYLYKASGNQDDKMPWVHVLRDTIVDDPNSPGEKLAFTERFILNSIYGVRSTAGGQWFLVSKVSDRADTSVDLKRGDRLVLALNPKEPYLTATHTLTYVGNGVLFGGETQPLSEVIDLNRDPQ